MLSYFAIENIRTSPHFTFSKYLLFEKKGTGPGYREHPV